MNHPTRRTFLKTSGALAAASIIGVEGIDAAPLKMPVGLQLYSVRNLLPKNFQGTLDQLLANQGVLTDQRISQFQFHFSLGQTF